MSKFNEAEQRLIDQVQGGNDIVSAPCAATRYCQLITKVALSVADTEFTVAAAYSEHISDTADLRERIELVQLVQDKLKAVQKIFEILEPFGFHATEHIAGMQSRSDDSGAVCSEYGLSVLKYPLRTWTDVAAVTFLVGQAVSMELMDAVHSSYRPWAQCAAELLPNEERSIEAAAGMIKSFKRSAAQKDEMQQALDKWYHNIGECYSTWLVDEESARLMGIRRIVSTEMTRNWRGIVEAELAALGFHVAKEKAQVR